VECEDGVRVDSEFGADRRQGPPDGSCANSDWLKASEVAALLNVTPSTCYKWARSGSVLTTRVNGVVRFDRASVLAMIEKGKNMQTDLVRERNRAIRAAARARSEETIGFEDPRCPGSFVIIVHPGQPKDVLEDPERLLR